MSEKRAALASVKEELKSIGAQLKEANNKQQADLKEKKEKTKAGKSTKTTAGGKKKVGGVGKSQDSSSKKGAGSVAAASSAKLSLAWIISASLNAGLALAEHRGYLLFGLAAAGIYAFGDYASI